MSNNVKLAWAVPRSDDFDVKDFALNLVEGAKENLQRDGDLVSAAFVITPDELQCYSIVFRDHDEKTAAYDELVKAAQAAHADALITCNDAYWKDNADRKYMEGYYPGKLAMEGAKECIMLTVSGPMIETWCVEVPYRRLKEGIEFGPHAESLGEELGFLANWGSAKPQVN
jgi:hypothetical protein